MSLNDLLALIVGLFGVASFAMHAIDAAKCKDRRWLHALKAGTSLWIGAVFLLNLIDAWQTGGAMPPLAGRPPLAALLGVVLTSAIWDYREARRNHANH
jgi:hypothetical protein